MKTKSLLNTLTMARVCEICGKNYLKVTKRSHSMRPTHTRLRPNLQWLKLSGRRVRACTRCLKTRTKQAAV